MPSHNYTPPSRLSKEGEQELRDLQAERSSLDIRHKEVVLRIARLEHKRLGYAYRFQNSHEFT